MFGNGPLLVNNFPRSVILPISHCQNIGWLLNMTFIIDRYHHSSVAVIPVNFESDPTNLTDFWKFAIILNEEINEQSFKTPTLELN